MNEGPVFVKIEEYKELLEAIDLVKEKIKKTKALLEEVEKLREEEEKEISTWSENLIAVEEKIYNIDKAIFGEK